MHDDPHFHQNALPLQIENAPNGFIECAVRLHDIVVAVEFFCGVNQPCVMEDQHAASPSQIVLQLDLCRQVTGDRTGLYQILCIGYRKELFAPEKTGLTVERVRRLQGTETKSEKRYRKICRISAINFGKR